MLIVSSNHGHYLVVDNIAAIASLKTPPRQLGR
jgi:hypothetical protein